MAQYKATWKERVVQNWTAIVKADSKEEAQSMVESGEIFNHAEFEDDYAEEALIDVEINEVKNESK